MSQRLRVKSAVLQLEVDTICYHFWLAEELEIQENAMKNKRLEADGQISGLQDLIHSGNIRR